MSAHRSFSQLMRAEHNNVHTCGSCVWPIWFIKTSKHTLLYDTLNRLIYPATFLYYSTEIVKLVCYDKKNKATPVTYANIDIWEGSTLSSKHNTFVSSYDKDDSSSFSLVVIMKEFNIYWPKNASAAAFLKKIKHHVATQAPWKLYKTFIFLLSKSHLHLSVLKKKISYIYLKTFFTTAFLNEIVGWTQF